MKPLLMMRTRGLTGPFFGRHAGNRSSHPLAHSQGNAISSGIIGSELIINGNFDSDISNWSQDVPTVSWVSGKLRASGSVSAASQIIETEIGKTYKLVGDMLIGSALNIAIYASIDSDVGNNIGFVGEAFTVIGATFNFVAVGTQTYIILRHNTTQNDFVEFDNISVKEVLNPVVLVNIAQLVTYMDDQGWSASEPSPGTMNVEGDDVTIAYLMACDFSSITPGALRHDLCQGMKEQGFCLNAGNCN